MAVYKHHVIVATSAQELEVLLDLEGDYEPIGTVVIGGKPAVITRHRILARMAADYETIAEANASLPTPA